jgi:pimeloyl-ACP methyl ester carboxylesterase
MTTTIDTRPRATSTSTVTSADGTKIVFERAGTGPPLVLVLGAFCDRSSAEALASGLADTFTVYRYDRRRRGDSGNTAPYSVQREVEDLAAVIQAAGEPAFVFGHSSGGSLVLEAAGAGVPIRALIVHEPPYTDGPNDEFAHHLEKLVADGHDSDAAAAFLELVGTPPAVIEQMQAGPHWTHMIAFAPSLAHEIRLSNNGMMPADRLANVQAPTLALAGQNSPPWAHAGAQAIMQTLPNGDARVLEGQGHAVADEVLIPVLKDFFS